MISKIPTELEIRIDNTIRKLKLDRDEAALIRTMAQAIYTQGMDDCMTLLNELSTTDPF